MKFSFLILSTAIALAQAGNVKFNVVAPTATEVKVSVNGQQVPLTAVDANVPYFTGYADIGEAKEYKYIAGGTEEPFTRKLDTTKQSTLNDFFNRSVTYANIPKLPWPIQNNPQWTRENGKPSLFDENYIPSIFFNGDAATVNNIVQNVPKDRVVGTLTVIGVDFANTYQNVSFGLHGAGKKKNNAKQSWNWELQPGDTLAKRTFFKLRHMEEDPTQIRERLYSDVLHALGTYANQATMVRLFINNEFYGTFNMLDDITHFSYINALFYGGKTPQQQGLLFDGQSGADFAVHTDDADGYGAWAPNPANAEGSDALDPLCKAFNTTDVRDNNALAAFEKQFDTDHFLRFMVMEYLAGHWDGYWMEQTNDGVFQEPETEKWYYLGQDYDATFGVNLAEPEGKDFISVSYKDFPTRYPGGVMINRLLENDNKRATFEKYLTETVRVLFNNATLTNRVLALHNFLLPDLQWDRSVVQKSPGINFGWNFDQVTQNLWQGVNAPNQNGGGADWGLIEWIATKSQHVAQEFNINVVTEPQGPPSNTSTVTPGGANTSSNVSSNGASDTTSANSAATKADMTSAGVHLVPTAALLAFVASAVALLL
ncbi:coth protein-domain-containing protein [Mycotypha africana]|uniref:coth protein-domain-containing protein n=1 Tax=Mycotypha africana TaxID=64632 RepID=UPI0023005D69|nr:coth protein-domain-containing protein [Mycotypha africana]KAI8991964.1 coth protein-domain-containing protein [Mycotypha africana]